MKSHLKSAEAPARAARRVCCGHAAKALASLAKSTAPDAVHEARKEIKKLRAVFRLARGTIRRSACRKLSQTMRLAAKPLGAVRDARVTQDALDLLPHTKPARFPNLRAALAANFKQQQRRFRDDDAGKLAGFVLQEIGQRLDRLKVGNSGWKALAPGLKKSYRRCRTACGIARLQPTPEHLHEWRKQVKNLWYQLQFLCPDWPPTTKALVDGLEKIGDKIGDDHDLVLLRQFAKEHCELSKEMDALNHLIDSRRKEFADYIQRQGVKVFAGKPKDVCRQIERDWKQWRKK